MHCRGRVLLVVGILALTTGVAVTATQGEPGAGAASPVAARAWDSLNDLRVAPAGSLRIEPAQRVPSLDPHLAGAYRLRHAQAGSGHQDHGRVTVTS